MMKKKTIPIRGMHCASCEVLIGEELKKIPHIVSVSVNQKKGKADISYTHDVSHEAIQHAIQEAGYEVGQAEMLPWFSRNLKDYLNLLRAVVVVFFLYAVFRMTGVEALGNNQDAESSLFVVLLIGIVAGLSTCMALIGGLVLGFSARHAEMHPEATRAQKFRPHLFFNLGRIAGYTALGGLIGLIGNAIAISPRALGWMTVIVGGVMILLGLKLIEIFPALKNKTITLPSSIARRLGITKEQKEYSHKAAMTAGALTFFLPCGFTQSMQLYAMTTGSVTKGALIMGLFALGTAPGLLGIGWLSSVMKGTKAKLFFAIAGVIVMLLGWYNIKNGLRLLPTETDAGMSRSPQTVEQPAVNNTQVLKATYTDETGLVPDSFTFKVGVPAEIVIDAQDTVRGCMSTILIPGLYNKPQLVQKGKTIRMAFTPKKKGVYDMTCAMGIPWGQVIVQ